MKTNELIGVTLEFKDGEHVSEAIIRIYMSAPDMYNLLKDMIIMHESGDFNLPEKISRRIFDIIEEKPDIISGAFE